MQLRRKDIRNPDPNSIEEYNNIKRKYDSNLDEKAKGAMARSRFKWVEEGEKNTKKF